MTQYVAYFEVSRHPKHHAVQEKKSEGSIINHHSTGMINNISCFGAISLVETRGILLEESL